MSYCNFADQYLFQLLSVIANLSKIYTRKGALEQQCLERSETVGLGRSKRIGIQNSSEDVIRIRLCHYEFKPLKGLIISLNGPLFLVYFPYSCPLETAHGDKRPGSLLRE